MCAEMFAPTPPAQRTNTSRRTRCPAYHLDASRIFSYIYTYGKPHNIIPCRTNLRRSTPNSARKSRLLLADCSPHGKPQPSPLRGQRSPQKPEQLAHAVPPRGERKRLLLGKFRVRRKRSPARET